MARRAATLRCADVARDIALFGALVCFATSCDESEDEQPRPAFEDGGSSQFDASADMLEYPAHAAIPECPSEPTILGGGGLDKASASSQFGTLEAVERDRLTIRSEDGMRVTLEWRGAALDELFMIDQRVEFAKDQTWSSVRGPRGVAFTRSHANFYPGLSAPIAGGPGLTTRPACGVAFQRCSEIDIRTYSDLAATWEGESAAIGSGETRTLGPWQVTNHGHVSTPESGHSTGACHMEPSTQSGASVLGPASALLPAADSDAGL
jgi:hypothetical protein